MIPDIENLQIYIDKNISQYEIAKIYGVNQSTVSLWFKKYNLKSKIKIGGSKGKNLIGQKFGKLTVLKLDHTGRHGKEYLCQCDCGNKKIYRGSLLTSGNIIGCGCEKGKNNIGLKKNDKAKSHIYEKFNKLTIIDIEETHHKNQRGYLMVCQCDCGNITKQIYSDLKSGKVKSCGCYQHEQASKTGSTIGLNNCKNNYNWYFIKNGEKIKCRSGFEVIYANYLIQNNIDFKYEPKTFKLDNGKRYTPDFYLINENKYIEIKGSFKVNESHQKENTKLFKINYNWDILYWSDIVEQCKLPLKTYHSYLQRARKLNIKEEDYLANFYQYVF